MRAEETLLSSRANETLGRRLPFYSDRIMLPTRPTRAQPIMLNTHLHCLKLCKTRERIIERSACWSSARPSESRSAMDPESVALEEGCRRLRALSHRLRASIAVPRSEDRPRLFDNQKAWVINGLQANLKRVFTGGQNGNRHALVAQGIPCRNLGTVTPKVL